MSITAVAGFFIVYAMTVSDNRAAKSRLTASLKLWGTLSEGLRCSKLGLLFVLAHKTDPLPDL